MSNGNEFQTVGPATWKLRQNHIVFLETRLHLTEEKTNIG